MDTNELVHSLQTASQLITVANVKAVDQHLADHDAMALEPAGVSNNAKDFPGETLLRIYTIARPALVFLDAALFLAPGWHKALKSLIAALDAITAPAQQKMPL